MDNYPLQKFDKKWILQNEPLTKEIINWTKSFGKFLSVDDGQIKPLSPSQLRKFFGELKKIQSNYTEFSFKIPLLAPKLAYAVGKSFNNYHKRADNKIQEFYQEIDKGIQACDSKESFEKLVQIVESIVAYRKYYDIN